MARIQTFSRFWVLVAKNKLEKIAQVGKCRLRRKFHKKKINLVFETSSTNTKKMPNQIGLQSVVLTTCDFKSARQIFSIMTKQFIPRETGEEWTKKDTNSISRTTAIYIGSTKVISFTVKTGSQNPNARRVSVQIRSQRVYF